MAQSLWNIPDLGSVPTPLAAMKEQASALRDETEGLLYGAIETSGSNERLSIDLQIVVPRLNKYTYNLIKYSQPMPLFYPGYIYYGPTSSGETVQNYEEFIGHFSKYLKSDKTKEILISLMAQARS